MTKINIHEGSFAGFVGELVEAGEKTSKVRVSMFGRETVVDLSNKSFSGDGEAFDAFATFEKDIATDRRWEANEASKAWWLAQRDVSAKTWAAHLDQLAGARRR